MGRGLGEGGVASGVGLTAVELFEDGKRKSIGAPATLR